MHLHALKQLFKIFYTFMYKKLSVKNFSSCRIKFHGKVAEKYVENLQQASRDM